MRFLKGAPRASKTSFRRSLVLGSIVLVVAAFIGCTLSLYLTVYRPLLADLTALEMRRASDQVNVQVQTIFLRVAEIARRDLEMAKGGLIDLDDVPKFDALFAPLFRGTAGITSVVVAEDTGHETLLVSSPDGGWFNRLTDPDSWGERGRFITWSRDGALTGDEQRSTSYDARKRPWFMEAMAQASDSEIQWTAPYRFVSTQELGISAVVSWKANDGHRYAMATDLRLLDLTRFTQDISVGKSGLAAILGEDGAVLAVPRDPRFADTEAISAAALEPVEKLGVTPLTRAFRAWQARNRPSGTMIRFTVAGSGWLASFSPFHLASQTFWIATMAPSSDFGALTEDTLALGVTLIIASTLIASFGALWLGRRFSAPIEQLTAESARIGSMDLRYPIEVSSAVEEIDALARSLEKMRLDFVRVRTELEAKAELERQLGQAQRMEALGRLAGGIAHDFNNILGSILGFARFLIEDLKPGTAERGFAQRIESAGERAKDLVEQIVAFSRSGSVERVPSDLTKILRDARDLLRVSLPPTVELDIDSDAAGLIADVNPGQIGQIIVNLCVNASDALAGKPGRVAVRLAALRPGEEDKDVVRASDAAPVAGTPRDETRLVIGTLRPDRAYAKMTVADTGPGMDAAVLKHILGCWVFKC